MSPSVGETLHVACGTPIADNSGLFLRTVFNGAAEIKNDPGSPDSATLVLLCRVSPAADYSLLYLDRNCTACFEENWSSLLCGYGELCQTLSFSS